MQFSILLFSLQAAFLFKKKPERNERDLCAFRRKLWKYGRQHFITSKGNSDRNGDIRSFFPWTACERLLEFTEKESVHKRVAGVLQTLTCEFITMIIFLLSAQKVSLRAL